MTFQSLLVCKDEQAASVLTSVLAGFGLGVQTCGYPDALCRLTEQKFDAVIVDYDDPHSAALVLQNAYQSSAPHKTVTVALLGDKTKVRQDVWWWYSGIGDDPSGWFMRTYEVDMDPIPPPTMPGATP